MIKWNNFEVVIEKCYARQFCWDVQV